MEKDFAIKPKVEGYFGRGPSGCFLAFIGVVAALSLGYALAAGYLPVGPFDAHAWRKAPSANNYDRLRMIEWLVRSGQLDGLSRSDALSLLGAPSKEGYFGDWDLVYWLGPERSLLSLDSEWLVIRFGANGQVSEYQVVSD